MDTELLDMLKAVAELMEEQRKFNDAIQHRIEELEKHHLRLLDILSGKSRSLPLTSEQQSLLTDEIKRADPGSKE